MSNTNTIQVIESFGNKLDEYIQTIAAKAGVAGEHFYPIFIRQQVIDGWIALGVYAVGLVLIACLMRMFFKNLPGIEEDIPKQVKVVTVGVLSIVVGMGLLMSLPTVNTSIGKIANPEYAAVQALVKMVK
jgi:hypothetical protein